MRELFAYGRKFSKMFKFTKILVWQHFLFRYMYLKKTIATNTLFPANWSHSFWTIVLGNANDFLGR
jgi:hypothetical protein